MLRIPGAGSSTASWWTSPHWIVFMCINSFRKIKVIKRKSYFALATVLSPCWWLGHAADSLWRWTGDSKLCFGTARPFSWLFSWIRAGRWRCLSQANSSTSRQRLRLPQRARKTSALRRRGTSQPGRCRSRRHLSCRGFHKWSYPNSWMVQKGKSHLDILGVPLFQETSMYLFCWCLSHWCQMRHRISCELTEGPMIPLVWSCPDDLPLAWRGSKIMVAKVCWRLSILSCKLVGYKRESGGLANKTSVPRGFNRRFHKNFMRNIDRVSN